METDQGLRPAYRPEELIRLVPEIADFARIHSRMILNLDSTNIHPGDWILMAKESEKAIRDGGFDGVVITHGTDTLSYSSSMLSFMIQNPQVPIVLTGAMHPAGTPGGDAEKNLLQAVQFAAYGPPGVYVVFNGRIIRGSRAGKVSSLDKDAFQSINVPPVGVFLNMTTPGGKPPHPIIEKIQWPRPDEKPMKIDTRIEPRVMAVKLTPGLEPRWLLEFCNKEKIRGLVIEGFGAGGIPFREPLNLAPVVEKFGREGIPVVITTQCLEGGVNLDTYEVGRKAVSAGAISAHDMSFEGAVTKLMWVLGRTGDPVRVRELMESDIAGEITFPAERVLLK